MDAGLTFGDANESVSVPLSVRATRVDAGLTCCDGRENACLPLSFRGGGISLNADGHCGCEHVMQDCRMLANTPGVLTQPSSRPKSMDRPHPIDLLGQLPGSFNAMRLEESPYAMRSDSSRKAKVIGEKTSRSRLLSY